MVIKRVGPLSCAKISAVLYAIVGLVIGVFFSLASLAGSFAPNASTNPAFPSIFGTAAIVIFPIIYGCMGFIATLIAAWLYNALAGMVGGIEVDLQ